MRKIYETDLDRQHQSEVGEYLERAWNCTFRASKALANVDGALFCGDEIQAVVEIKNRRNDSTKYPTYMLSAYKWRCALEISKEYGVPFMLVVKFTDGVFAAKLKDDYPIKTGGRYDRGDAMDVEDCIYIPMEEFKKV